ncbi:MAG: hypothetical protein GY793_07620 [Proteobacteria bacterium]|nr:hypothetical protein [Pseudomonadota bacterium]
MRRGNLGSTELSDQSVPRKVEDIVFFLLTAESEDYLTKKVSRIFKYYEDATSYELNQRDSITYVDILKMMTFSKWVYVNPKYDFGKSVLDSGYREDCYQKYREFCRNDTPRYFQKIEQAEEPLPPEQPEKTLQPAEPLQPEQSSFFSLDWWIDKSLDLIFALFDKIALMIK